MRAIYLALSRASAATAARTTVPLATLKAMKKVLTSMWIRVLNPLQLVLSPLKENGKLSWVANITVTFEFNADLDGTVSPDIPANAPVERILEGAPVERFDVRFVRL